MSSSGYSKSAAITFTAMGNNFEVAIVPRTFLRFATASGVVEETVKSYM